MTVTGRTKAPRSFYRKNAVALAKDLLGQVLCTNVDGKITAGIIVETEAYCGKEDKGCHTFGGKRTPKNEAMYMREGSSYVYIIYGIHHDFNVVAWKEGEPHAVLIRALEPTEGIELMKERRGKEELVDLTSGPGKLCKAMNITKTLHNKEDLLGDKIWIERGRKVNPKDIVTRSRIGIQNYAKEHTDLPYRFYIEGNEFVSRK